MSDWLLVSTPKEARQLIPLIGQASSDGYEVVTLLQIADDKDNWAGLPVKAVWHCSVPSIDVNRPMAAYVLSEALTDWLQTQTAGTIWASASTAELAIRLACRLPAMFWTNVSQRQPDSGALMSPVYGGAGYAVYPSPAGEGWKVAITRLQSASFTDEIGQPIVKTILLEGTQRKTPDLSCQAGEASQTSVSLVSASVVVSGGRGLKDSANFFLIDELAHALSGAVGASRAVVDAGWRPHHEQVGQTGKTVSPELYVAVGISGALQHQVGMMNSRHIVAINRDAETPMVQMADLSLIGDALEIVPAILDKLKVS